MCVHAHALAMVYIWRSKELVLSKNQFQAIRHGGVYLYPLTGPKVKFLLKMTHTALPHLSSEVSSFPILIKQEPIYTKTHSST